jgi:hypothetical protein
LPLANYPIVPGTSIRRGKNLHRPTSLTPRHDAHLTITCVFSILAPLPQVSTQVPTKLLTSMCGSLQPQIIWLELWEGNSTRLNSCPTILWPQSMGPAVQELELAMQELESHQVGARQELELHQVSMPCCCNWQAGGR